MVTPSEAGIEFNNALLEAGGPIRFRYFSVSTPGAGSYYDDDITLAQSGADLWISGVVQPLKGGAFSQDGILLQQGLVKENDLRLYVAGSIDTSTTGSTTWKVGLGSPVRDDYSLTGEGVQGWEVGGVTVYKKMFISRLLTGSLPEE